jgi:hypothetical protein
MDNNYTLHIKLFNDRVRAMNQSNAKLLTLNAEEARSLQAEIYDLMTTVASLTQRLGQDTTVGEIVMDGGGFK